MPHVHLVCELSVKNEIDALLNVVIVYDNVVASVNLNYYYMTVCKHLCVASSCFC